VFRISNERSRDYTDNLVSAYLETIGDSPSNYTQFCVVPKTNEIAYKAISRYDKDPNILSEEIIVLYTKVSYWLDLEYGPVLSDSKISSWDEVVEWLQDGKSSGYPWTLKYPFKEDYYTTDEHARFYNTFWERLGTPNPIPVLASVSVKEELREAEKVAQGKGRTTIAFDTNHTIALLQCTLHQNRRLVATNLQHASALGLNNFDGGFARLHTKLSPPSFGAGKNTGELDGKEFDSRFYALLFALVYAFRFRMLSPILWTVSMFWRFFNLMWMICTAIFVMPDGQCYFRWGGNGSGQGNTTPDNIFKNTMDVWVLWCLIVPAQYRNWAAFKEHVVVFYCGDDIIISISPFAQGLGFTIANMIANAYRIGMVYTTPSVEMRHPEDCTFVGHGFKKVFLPTLGYPMWLPSIDCCKMRNSCLRYNDENRSVELRIAATIVRACGLRNETFACESCRTWFAELVAFLRNKYHTSPCIEIKNAFKAYKTDAELWELYTGLTTEDLSALYGSGRTPFNSCAAPNSSDFVCQALRPCPGLLPAISLSAMGKNKKPKLQKRASSSKKTFTIAKSSKKKKVSIAPVVAAVIHEEVKAEVKKVEAHPAPDAHHKHLKSGAQKWLSAILDPFTHVPPSIGSSNGSAVITTRNIATMTSTPATDCFRAVIIPRGQNPFGLFVGSTAAPLEAQWTWANGFNGNLLGSSPQGRPLAMGIRYWVQINNNDKPGQWVAGMFPFAASTDITQKSYTAVQNLGSSVIGPATSKGNLCAAKTVWLPLDNQDGEFGVESTASSSTYRTTNVLYLFSGGWPASTTVNVEFIMHTEALPSNDIGIFSGIAKQSSDDWSEMWDAVMAAGGAHLIRATVKFGMTRLFSYLIDRTGLGFSRSVATGASEGSSSSTPQLFPGHDELRDDPPPYDGPWYNTQTRLLMDRAADLEYQKRLRALEARVSSLPAAQLATLLSQAPIGQVSVTTGYEPDSRRDSLVDLSTLDLSSLPSEEARIARVMQRFSSSSSVQKRASSTK